MTDVVAELSRLRHGDRGTPAMEPMQQLPLGLPPLFPAVEECPSAFEPTEEEAAMTSRLILDALLRRHALPEWASFPEMRCTGWQDETRIDLFSLNTYPSKRLHSVAYEIKISRGDFLRELKNPCKRALAERVGAELYFVSPARLIRPDELPDGWGLVEMHSYGLRMKVRPERRARQPFPVGFVAALARRAPAGAVPLREEATLEPVQ